MDELIFAVFGDDSIFLDCNSGECLHYTMVPGFEVIITCQKKSCEILRLLFFLQAR